MQTLTKDGYRDLMNKVGSVAKFYTQQIEELKYNPDFYEAFDTIKEFRGIQINDKIYTYPSLFRIIDRGNETICLVKDVHSEENEYEDKIIYYLTVDFNKRIKMYINYNDIAQNGYSDNNIYFEVLENYDRKECGDVYGNGRITYEQEEGYKGKISVQDSVCTLEYGKYDYEHTTVVLPEETYDSNPVIPQLKDMDKEIVTYKLTQGVNNPVYLALNELEKEKIRQRQRIR